MLRATTACTFSALYFPKVVRTWCDLCILISRCASRHNSVHFFDIVTSRSAPTLSIFCIFCLGNVLRATTACFFSTSQFPKVLRDLGVLYILISNCASRHKGLLFFTLRSPNHLKTRRRMARERRGAGLLLLVWRHHIRNNILKMC